jgi:hypothetical protein
MNAAGLSAEERAAIERFIEKMGEGTYSDVKFFPDGEVAWLARFIFTSAILYGLEPFGHRDRWCYETMADARRALDEWNGQGEPEGWHRHPATGRRYYKDSSGNRVLVIRP